jgi:ADP-ribose pyrophosphatase YjhB (NUDIX family)
MADTLHGSTKWRPPQIVRAIAIAVVRRGGRGRDPDEQLLVMRVCDDAGRTKGWRPLGGAIELGEHAAATVERELREELDVAVESSRFVGVLENIYEHEGAKGHELVMVHEVTLEASAYERGAFTFADGGVAIETKWLPLATFRSGEAELFPKGLLALLDAG